MFGVDGEIKNDAYGGCEDLPEVSQNLKGRDVSDRLLHAISERTVVLIRWRIVVDPAGISLGAGLLEHFDARF